MMLFENGIAKAFEEGAKKLFNAETGKDQISVQNTRKEFEGDYTINIFPFLQKFREAPEKAADKMGRFLCENTAFISKYNVIKGFLNLTVSDEAWLKNFTKHSEDNRLTKEGNGQIMIEFSSPNTNKPLHLGHIRNNLLGESLARIIERSGKKVIKVNLVNDRGIHICKSMLAWQKYGCGATPESTGMKGDKLVGEFYVKFDREYKNEVELLITKGMTGEEAAEKASLMLEAKDMLRKWESGDKEVTGIWKMMNSWVYDGFEATYQKLGITFDKTYYESDTYKLGKKIVQEGLNNAVFYKKEDGSVWIDLTG
ncbi:MAG: arginine--tRNA ligase, partial [Bacteroidota bacterium]